jgi:hypothetical protein
MPLAVSFLTQLSSGMAAYLLFCLFWSCLAALPGRFAATSAKKDLQDIDEE